jgi:hypothetical protein
VTPASATDRIPAMDTTQPKTLASRVRDSEARKLQAGGRRMPGGVMPKDAAEALDILQREQYGDSASACIFRALIEAAEKFRKP